MIRRYKLYPDKRKAGKTARKRARALQKPKKRITQLVKEGRPCFLFQLDTIVIYWNNLKRYILTAVDHAAKLGYARMYKNKSSRSAADFLYHLRYLVKQPIENLQTDYGSEFAREFETATARLGIQRYFSRVKTPKDNPGIERFNETLKYIEKELVKIRSPVLPIWSATTQCSWSGFTHVTILRDTNTGACIVLSEIRAASV